MEIKFNLQELNSSELSFVYDVLISHFVDFEVYESICSGGSCIVHFEDEEENGYIDTYSDSGPRLIICYNRGTKNIRSSIEILGVILAHYVLKNDGKCERCTSNLHAGMYPFDK